MKTSDKGSPTFENFSSSLQRVVSHFKQKLEGLFALIKHIYKYVNESQSKVLPFALALVILIFMLIYNLGRADNPFVYDSAHYWEYADDFYKDASFSFTNYINGLRGYLFPFLLFLIKAQAGLFGLDARLLFYVYSALFFAALSVYILPWSFQTIFGWKVTLIGRALIGFLLFYFWRGHFLYPLSDFPAYTAFLVGIAFLTVSLTNKNILLWAVLTGVFMGVALNIRPIYQASLIILIPFIFLALRKMGMVKTARWAALVFLGFTLVLFPQFHLNRIHFQASTPLVLTRWSDDNLYKKQLFWGLKTQKYEANFGSNYPFLAVVYEDPVWLKLQKSPLIRDKTLENYFKLIQRFPLDIFIRHYW